MKVLHLLSSSRFSGAENVACQIIHMMKDDDNYKMVYCSPDGQIRDALKERGVTYSPIKSMSVWEISRVLKREKPDVIHAHDMRASFFAAITCGSVPFISHIHNNNFDSRGLTLKAVLFRFAAVKAKHIFWVSQSAQNGYVFSKSLSEKSSILYNIVDVEQLWQKAIQAENQTAYDVVYLGRLTYPKNPERLLNVLEEVINKKPDIQAAIIGSGELEDTIHKMIAEKRLEHNVHCLGFMSNPYGILRNAKVMLMTSRWEGFPMCALEAQALGVPIVSTPTDGLAELIEDGKDGFLSENDQILVERVLAVVSEPALYASMSAIARDRAVRINNRERCADYVKTVYSRIKHRGI